MPPKYPTKKKQSHPAKSHVKISIISSHKASTVEKRLRTLIEAAGYHINEIWVDNF
jgi:hypothetical protein